MSKEEVLLNENIRLREVRCIGEDGEQFGIISSREALDIAIQRNLDLVLISPNANPPVCKIMDYGKYKYQIEKKQKEAKKKQKQIEIKEIKLSVQIAQNDIAYKVKHAREFLESGKHVKFRVFLKQREVTIPGIGLDLLSKIQEMLADIASAEKEAKLEGRYVNILLIPKKNK